MNTVTRSVLFLLALISLTACAVTEMAPSVANGGRAVAIAVHPTNADRMMVASETGGLFQSTDHGASWKQVSLGSTFGFTDVMFVPNNPSVVIAAAAADMHVVSGGGVWRSTNNGASWEKATMTTPSADCTNNLSAFGLAAEPSSNNRLWVATQCGLEFSTDDGATWQSLAPGTGYSNDKSYAVLAPASNKLRILTDAGVKVSDNGGSSWTVSNAGLPGYVAKGVRTQIAVSPLNPAHLYWAFNSVSGGNWHISLYRSTDSGANWSSLSDVVGINRPPFVKTTRSTDGTTYDLFFGDGGCGMQHATVTSAGTPTVGAWSSYSTDHCDQSDVGFDTNGRTPLLLAGDGGLQNSTDGGANWKLTAGSAKGYNALQITEVTGQLHSADSSFDLYYATQDNDILASGDSGATWPNRTCCEGFFLGISRDALAAADTKFTTVDCSGCSNLISGALLAGLSGFPDPTNSNGNPKLLKPGYYVEHTTGNTYAMTSDNGVHWADRYTLGEPPMDFPRSGGSSSAPIVFTAVKDAGTTSDGQDLLSIQRVTGATGTGTPIVSSITGFGGLGTFPTMFAWYKPFGVDPANTDRIIVADIIDNAMKRSADGGATWSTDTAMTTLVTDSGKLKFRSGAFTQVTSYGFDPTCRGHILVGTLQSGILQSHDYGNTWKRVSGSMLIPNVSSFFYPSKGVAIASSYGRGLWKVKYDCNEPKFPRSDWVLAEPLIKWKGGYIPISQIHNPDACPVCGWVLVDNGKVVDYRLQEGSDQMQKVMLSGGRMHAYSWEGRELDVPFEAEVGEGRGTLGGDKELAELVARGKYNVVGFFVEGRSVKGAIVAQRELSAKELPQPKAQGAHIEVDLPPVPPGVGIPVTKLHAITVRAIGFAPRTPIEVVVDGESQRLERATTDERGAFSVVIDKPFGVGGHSILVRQKTDRGLVQDVVTFHVTVQDFDARRGKGRDSD